MREKLLSGFDSWGFDLKWSVIEGYGGEVSQEDLLVLKKCLNDSREREREMH